MVRYPAVAGQFYRGTASGLDAEIRKCFASKIGPGRIPKLDSKGPRGLKGLVVPHAGYTYSGPVAAHAYGKLAEDGFPQTFVILGPNHRGFGSGVAVTTHAFRTPLGDVAVDEELARSMMKDLIDDDIVSHRSEHSIEVQLPFLQFFGAKFKFVPVCMGIQDYKAARRVGEIVGESIRGKDVVVLASTDFSHYVPMPYAYKVDRLAIDKILALDPKGMDDIRQAKGISMCGYGPVVAMLTAVDGSSAELLKYATSGDVHDMEDVVGYAAIAVR